MVAFVQAGAGSALLGCADAKVDEQCVNAGVGLLSMGPLRRAVGNRRRLVRQLFAASWSVISVSSFHGRGVTASGGAKHPHAVRTTFIAPSFRRGTGPGQPTLLGGLAPGVGEPLGSLRGLVRAPGADTFWLGGAAPDTVDFGMLHGELEARA